MPTPNPGSETRDEWMQRCIPQVLDDGTAADSEQAAAICSSMWDEATRANSEAIMKHAYSMLTLKAIDEDQRIITGIATTPQADLMDDIVEPDGAEFKLPIPLLRNHDNRQPIGNVTRARITKDGIEITARIVKIAEPGPLQERIDTAWQEIKSGLVRGLSIGFKALETAEIKGSFGLRFIKWAWLELSAVVIPANSQASIQTIRSFDSGLLAASGKEQSGDSLTGVAVPNKPVKAKEAKTMAPKRKTFAEQIAAFVDTRKAKADRMDEIMNDAAEAGETLDAAAKEEYDTLAGEVKEIDEHLARLRDREEANKQKAAPVNGESEAQAQQSRAGMVIHAQPKAPKLEPGILMTRYVRSLLMANGNRHEAAELAKHWKDTPQISEMFRIPKDVLEKAAVAAGTTTDSTWAEPLAQYTNMASEFVEYLRGLTIMGRISGFRQVPFMVKVPRQTSGATVNWIGEGKVKPLSALAFDSLTLAHTKIAGIVPLTEELVRFSSPSAEALVRNDLAAAVVEFMDSQFIDPTVAAAAGVNPASVTNGVTPVPATGTTAAAFRTDVTSLMSAFLSANIPVGTGHWIMTQNQALQFSLMRTALDQPEFPQITMNGGTLLGFPVVTSENVPATGGSPTDGYPIIFVVAGEVLLADDGGVNIDISREASLQMDSAPDSPVTASTVLVSLWQHNMIALKAERFVNWVKRRDAAAGYISYAKYVA